MIVKDQRLLLGYLHFNEHRASEREKSWFHEMDSFIESPQMNPVKGDKRLGKQAKNNFDWYRVNDWNAFAEHLGLDSAEAKFGS